MIWVVNSQTPLGAELCRQLENGKFPYISSGSELNTEISDSFEKFILSKETEFYTKYHNKPELDPDIGRIKWIINCAATENPDVSACTNIARAARSHSAKLIHISTDYEDLNSKSKTEEAIASATTQYYVLRTQWLYGYDGNNFVSDLLNEFSTSESVKASSNIKGSPTFCGDVAEAAIRFIVRTQKSSGFFGKNSIPAFGFYNFAASGFTNQFDFAKKIFELVKKYEKTEIACTIEDEISEEHKLSSMPMLDCTKIAKELKIKIPSWQQSLETFIKNKNSR